MGYLTITDPERRLIESDTNTCPHCGGVWEIKSTDPTRAVEGRWCFNCNRAVCPQCADKGCVPILKQIEEQMARAKLCGDILG